MSRRRRTRHLDAEEKALWHHVVRSVTPLKSARTDPAQVLPAIEPQAAADPSPAPAADLPPAPAGTAQRPRVEPVSARASAPPPLAPLDPRLKRRLSRGTQGAQVDARLDLHGLTQAAAHRRLALFLREAHVVGFALVLVITGKGEGEGAPLPGEERRGVLRRAVPLWLAEPELRPYVVGFETAARRHGGEGALYIRVRRGRAAPGRHPA